MHGGYGGLELSKRGGNNQKVTGYNFFGVLVTLTYIIYLSIKINHQYTFKLTAIDVRCMGFTCRLLPYTYIAYAGLHKLWYPSIRDTSTWSKFGAHGEHGDVFLFSNLGAL